MVMHSTIEWSYNEKTLSQAKAELCKSINSVCNSIALQSLFNFFCYALLEQTFFLGFLIEHT